MVKVYVAVKRRLQPGDMRLERDRDLVAEASLKPGGHRAQEPGGDRRYSKPDRRDPDQASVAVDHSVA